MKNECDIILLSYESPELLKKCVQSILDHTKIPSRLIVVDNASQDPEVRDFLKDLSGKNNIHVEKVFSEENKGFAAGMNKGIRLADAPYICLLNNDCVVTKGWLKEMISIANCRNNIGLVNPHSNTFGLWPDESASIHEHANLLEDKKGKFVELGHSIGFACLIKKEVVDTIGYLDPVYEGVCYEDTDFSIRAQKAGFISVMAEGAYVFHKEQASRKSLPEKEKIYHRNQKIFESRWGGLIRVFYLLDAGKDENKICDCYKTLKALARERAIVDMWMKHSSSEQEIMSILKKKNIVKHADIGLNPKNRLLKLAAFWKILFKKKKYSAIIVNNDFFYIILKALKYIHKAEVFSIEDNNRFKSDKGVYFDLNKPSLFAEYLRG